MTVEEPSSLKPRFRELAAIKERELHEVYESAISRLETQLKERDAELLGTKEVVAKLQEDFLYNISLLEARDEELAKLDEANARSKADVGDREERLTQVHLDLDARDAELEDLHFAAKAREDRHREEVALVRRECEEEGERYESRIASLREETEAVEIRFEERLRKLEDDAAAKEKESREEFEEQMSIVRKEAERVSTAAAETERHLRTELSAAQMAAEVGERWRNELADSKRDLERKLRDVQWAKKDAENVFTARVAELENLVTKTKNEAERSVAGSDERSAAAREEAMLKQRDLETTLETTKSDLVALFDAYTLSKNESEQMHRDFEEAVTAYERQLSALSDDKAQMEGIVRRIEEEKKESADQFARQEAEKNALMGSLRRDLEENQLEKKALESQMEILSDERSALQKSFDLRGEDMENLRYHITAEQSAIADELRREKSEAEAKVRLFEHQLRNSLNVTMPNVTGPRNAAAASSPDRFSSQSEEIGHYDEGISRVLREDFIAMARVSGDVVDGRRGDEEDDARIWKGRLVEQQQQTETLKRIIREMREDMERHLAEQDERARTVEDERHRLSALTKELEALKASHRDSQILLSEKQNMIDRLFIANTNSGSQFQSTSSAPAASSSISASASSAIQKHSHSSSKNQKSMSDVIGEENDEESSENEETISDLKKTVERYRSRLATAVKDLKRLAGERSKLAESSNALRAQLRWLTEGMGKERREIGTQTKLRRRTPSTTRTDDLDVDVDEGDGRGLRWDLSKSSESDDRRPLSVHPSVLLLHPPSSDPRRQPASLRSRVMNPSASNRRRTGSRRPVPASNRYPSHRHEEGRDTRTAHGGVEKGEQATATNEREALISRGVRNWNWKD